MEKGREGWSKCHPPGLLLKAKVKFDRLKNVTSHKGGVGGGRGGEMTPKITWGGGVRMFIKSVTYYLNGPLAVDISVY